MLGSQALREIVVSSGDKSHAATVEVANGAVSIQFASNHQLGSENGCRKLEGCIGTIIVEAFWAFSTEVYFLPYLP